MVSLSFRSETIYEKTMSSRVWPTDDYLVRNTWFILFLPYLNCIYKSVVQPQWLRLPLWHNSEGALHPTLLMGISFSCGISLWLLSCAGGDSSLVAPRKSERWIFWSQWDITAVFSFLFFSLFSVWHIRDRFYFLSFLLLLFMILFSCTP